MLLTEIAGPGGIDSERWRATASSSPPPPTAPSVFGAPKPAVRSPTLNHLNHPEAPPVWATTDHDANRILACGPDARRSFGWFQPDADSLVGLRWLPAEFFGPLPEE